jgi:hypothetical protein
MIKSEKAESRDFPLKKINADLVVTGGGLSGICCAITAARQGLKVVLVHDRSVLGGNASSEVRLWILGATSHMGNNNRWAREGGVVDEILVENTFRNPEGNPVILDAILLDKVAHEQNITLLLNTAAQGVTKQNADIIQSIRAYCSQNQTEYELSAPFFCDASGDGVIGFLSGAAFRMGAESKEEFGELFAPDASYGELLGHTLYFYSKDVGKPVTFVPPSFALDDITRIPRFRSFNAKEYGSKLWWIEYGGRMDTVHDTESIKWELWKIVYGVWNHIKNSGNFPEAENLTLEWVGMIPGKRESRRFEGDYILTQQDIVEQREHPDAVAFGGWSIDLHPADGVYSSLPSCNQWHSKGIYQIPYRCLYSRNIRNLFLAGRIISVSHVAFGSSRVMATGAYVAQAAGVAAAKCKALQCLPADLVQEDKMQALQQALTATGQFIPGIRQNDGADLARQAKISASSELQLKSLPAQDIPAPLDISVAQMLPFQAGTLPSLYFDAETEAATTLLAEIRISSQKGSYTPDKTLENFSWDLQPGKNYLSLRPTVSLPENGYVFIVLHKNPGVRIYRNANRITGILSVFNTTNPAVSNYGKQEAPEGIGVDSFEFWCPQRRPDGLNIALDMESPIAAFQAGNVINGTARPTSAPNAWVADFHDVQPVLHLDWTEPKSIKRLLISFDTDFDHPMESVLMTHPESVMPFCIRNYKILDGNGQVIFEKTGNYLTRNEIEWEQPVTTRRISIQVEHPSACTPAAIFEVNARTE